MEIDVEITRADFEILRIKYHKIMDRWASGYPSFARFISPANFSMICPTRPRDTYVLSITGKKRWAAINSPYAEALLKAWWLNYRREFPDAP